jgi:hypothetical protein
MDKKPHTIVLAIVYKVGAASYDEAHNIARAKKALIREALNKSPQTSACDVILDIVSEDKVAQ